jgi:hypothetical protein
VQDVREEIGTIRLNSIGPPGEELPHHLWIVDRPDVHGEVSPMSLANEARTCHAPILPAIWNLERRHGWRVRPTPGKAVKKIEEAELASGGRGRALVSVAVRAALFFH